MGRLSRSAAVVAVLLLPLLFPLEMRGQDDPEPPPRSGSLAGTTWSFRTTLNSRFTLRFEKGGSLTYTSDGGSTAKGTWEQKGPAVSWEINKYSQYKGTIKGRQMTGSATNRDGRAWMWTAEKK